MYKVCSRKGSGIIILNRKNSDNDKFVIGLFLIIILNLTPVIMASTIIPGLNSRGIYPIIVGSNFLIQTGIIVFYFIFIKKIKIKIKLILLAWAFMTSQMITLLLSLFSDIQVNYFDFINATVRFLSVFIFICIPFQLEISKKNLIDFMVYIVALGLVACLYNVIVNFYGIRSILSINSAYAVDFKSFYLNRNSFGQLLLITIIANTILFFNRRKTFSGLSYLIIGFNIFATLSRTVIASVGLFMVSLYLIYLRKKIKFKYQMMVLITVAVAFFIILSDLNVLDFISNILIREEMGTTNRSDLWRMGAEILNRTNWIFGVGAFTGKEFIIENGFSQFHSFYMETLVGGGIVDLLLHLIMFVIILKKVKTIYINDMLVGSVYFSGYISLMVYSIFESSSFVSMGYVDSLFMIFFITIPLLYANSFLIQRDRKN